MKKEQLYISVKRHSNIPIVGLGFVSSSFRTLCFLWYSHLCFGVGLLLVFAFYFDLLLLASGSRGISIQLSYKHGFCFVHCDFCIVVIGPTALLILVDAVCL